MKRKNIIKVVAASLCFVLIFSVLTKLFEPKWNYIGNQAQTRVQAFYHQEKDTHDVIYLGASFTYCGISPLQIYKEQGITGYDMCNPAQKAWISKAYLEEALKTQSPKVVVYEVGPIFDDEESDEGHNRKNIDYMKWSSTKMDAIEEICSHTDESKKDYLFPFLRFHSRWSDIKKSDFYIFYDKNYYLMGTALKMTTKPASDEKIAAYEAQNDSGTPAEIGPRCRQAVLDMKKLCEEKGAKLQLVRMTSMEWSAEQSRAVEAFANENGLSFVDMNRPENQKEIGVDWKTDSHDAGQHVNILGCVKTSSFLGKYLTENYQFDTKLSKETKTTWDNAAKKWSSLVDAYSMPIIDDLGEYAKAMQNKDFITAIALNGSIGDQLSESQRKELEAMGLTLPANGSNDTYVALLDGSKVVKQSANPETIKYKGIKFDLASQNDGTASIKVNDKEYALNTAGLNIVLYDKTLGQPTDVVTFNTTAEGVPAEHTEQPLVEDDGGE